VGPWTSAAGSLENSTKHACSLFQCDVKTQSNRSPQPRQFTMSVVVWSCGGQDGKSWLNVRPSIELSLTRQPERQRERVFLWSRNPTPKMFPPFSYFSCTPESCHRELFVQTELHHIDVVVWTFDQQRTDDIEAFDGLGTKKSCDCHIRKICAFQWQLVFANTKQNTTNCGHFNDKKLHGCFCGQLQLVDDLVTKHFFKNDFAQRCLTWKPRKWNEMIQITDFFLESIEGAVRSSFIFTPQLWDRIYFSCKDDNAAMSSHTGTCSNVHGTDNSSNRWLMRFAKQVPKFWSLAQKDCGTNQPMTRTTIRNPLWNIRPQTKGFLKIGSQICWQQLASWDMIWEPFLKRFLILKRVPN